MTKQPTNTQTHARKTPRSHVLLMCLALIALLAAGTYFLFLRDHLPRHALIQSWQSYAAAPRGAEQVWTDGGEDYSVERLAPVTPDFRTGYLYVSQGKLVAEDLATGKFYVRSGEGFQPADKVYARPRYSTQSHDVFLDSQNSRVMACKHTDASDCHGIDIKKGTWPYVYAASGESVVAVTNYGEGLLFSNESWCRMSKGEEGEYACVTKDAPMQEEPSNVQFYSSLVYDGKTLVGQWPSGWLYEFDGKTLSPSVAWTPPAIRESGTSGFEAQSMALYCGDLFVGYWPLGEVYRYDGASGEWGLFRRFFTKAEGEEVYPHYHRSEDGLPPQFFGQRITALVPLGDSLFVATSNYREWTADIRPSFLSEEEIAEYGAIYRIHKPGCQTTYPAG